ncbi:hypothetical protein ABB37_04699 [Leptomonas pyrrhocoris]|uniref:Thioredoxin-like fold domain-containing protein n=1 Tax=Leptomonas pyrrhocoris TaxID=157538 RepID=A0A0M9G1V9_LEPPY|nr:hypothetical protein ABB37_04699 [Leptomonas pyrrhocoris]KPA80479.1 hypothetical protein ABB37_04699 [Leptomonas pyrrhocoris]|eukprot:XP_015658918.1 hypothetical protein ABB37_04699 [Leptomonas pyrrhocoris]
MDYLLGVLYATKKYEFLDTSRLQQGADVHCRLADNINVNPTATSAGDDGDTVLAAKRARRSTARPAPSPATILVNIADGLHRNGADADVAAAAGATNSAETAAAAPAGAETSFHGEGDEAAGTAWRSPAMSANVQSARLLSSSLKDGGAVASFSLFSQPRESGALSPLLPGLSVPAAAIAAAAADGAANIAAAIPCPQRLEYNVPTRVLAGKYVLVYLVSPHRPITVGHIAQLWGGSPGGAVAGANQPSGVGGGGGGGNRSVGPPSGPTLLNSPQMEPLKGRFGGAASASSLLPGFSPHVSPQASAARPSFTAALAKSSDPFSSGGNPASGHPHGLSATAAAVQPSNGQPLPLSAVRATAAAVTTHQKLLLFYCLLLRRLASRPVSEKAPPSKLIDDEEGVTVATTQVPVAVLELHYTTEGPLRNNSVGPTTASGGNQGASDAHGGATPSGSLAGVSAGGVGGGGGSGLAGPSGSGQHSYSLPPGSPLTAPSHPTQFSSGASGASGGRSISVHPVSSSSTNSGGNANVGGFSSTMASAMVSPHLMSPGLGSFSAVDDAAAEPTASRLLSSILRHLQEGKPDAWLSPDKVVFDSDITQNPYYGGWYAVKSNDGYRRVMQLSGVQSWPAVILVDPAGNIVTVSALQHVEEELAQFTAEVEANLAKSAAAVAAAAAAAAAERPTPADSPSSLPPSTTVTGPLVLNSTAEERVASDGAKRQPSQAISAADDGSEAVPSPLPSHPLDAATLGPGAAASEGKADTNTSPLTASSSPVAPGAADGGRVEFMFCRSSTSPLARTAEGAAMNMKAERTMVYSPSRLDDSKSTTTTSAHLREPSIPCDDPQIPTADPTPIRQMPTTARYRDDGAIRAIPLAEEMTPVRHDGGGDERGSSATQGFSLPSSIPQLTSITSTVKGTSTSDEQRLTEVKSGSTEAFHDIKKQSGSWTGEKEGEDTHEKSTSLALLPPAQPPMLHMLESRAANNVSASNYSLNNSSFTEGYVSLPSWNPKAYGGDVAGVIAVHGMESESNTPIHTGSKSLFVPGGQKPLPPMPPSKSQQQQQHPAGQDLSSHDAVVVAGGGGGGKEAAVTSPEQPSSSAPHAALSEGSQKVALNTSSSKVPRDLMAAASGVSAIPRLPASLVQLPLFTSHFPWNLMMPEPIMVYTTPSNVKHVKGKGSEEGGKAESAQKAFQRHVQERVEERKRNESPAARAASHKPRPPAMASKDEPETAAGTAATTVNAADHGIDGSSGTLSATASTRSAAVVMPAAMVLRQSIPSGLGRIAAGSTGASTPDGGGLPLVVEAGNGAATPQLLVRVPTAQLELTTFAETSPLVVSERNWPVHPLRRIVLCSIPVAEVAERARNAANNGNTDNNNNFLFAGEETRTIPSGSPPSAVAVNTTAALNTTPSSLVMLPLSIGDSTDDGTHPSRSSSPLSHSVRPDVSQPPPSLDRPQQQQQQQRASLTMLEDWLQDTPTKFDASTNVLLLFGAGWHPGMSKCVRALRRLQDSINGRSPNDAKRADGDTAMSSGGRGVADRQGFDGGRDENADVDDGLFPALNGFNNNSVEWPAGGFGGLDGGGGRLDMRGFSNFNMSDGEPTEDEGQSPLRGRTSYQRGRIQSTSPSGVLAVEPPPPPPADGVNVPRYRMQVIYISADESSEEVRHAVSAMPPQWLCLSPYVAQSTAERQLQQLACDGARKIFRVTSFPRVVVVELPAAQQAPGKHTQDTTSQVPAAGAGERGDAGTPGGGEEATDDGEAFGGTNPTTTTAAAALQRQQTEELFEDLWTVVQLHGETQLNADPEGKKFPWSNSSSDVLRISRDAMSALPREEQRAWTCLLSSFQQQQQRQQGDTPSTTSLHQSPVLGCSNPDDVDVALSRLRTAPTRLVTVDQEDDTAAPRDAASITRAPSPPPVSLARLFPPLKPFAVGDGELLTLLERGGYFVVLGAFGSIDAQLHQQCVSALEEVRTWFYAEVEERKEQAWREPTRLQVMAPHGTYSTSFTVGGDRVVLPPAVHVNSSEEYGTPTRYSPGIPAAALLPEQGGGGVAGTAVASSLSHGGGTARVGTPFLLDEGWPEGRTFLNSSPNFSSMTPPMSGGPGAIPLDGSTSLHNQQLSYGSIGGPGVGGSNKAPAVRPLPSVFFYDSILTNPHHPHRQSVNITAASPAAAAPVTGVGSSEGLTQVAAAPWVNASPTSARAASPSPVPVPHVMDNTASLRRHHAKDLAVLQEYVIAPIFENNEKMLPVREGEVYLALVRWPQRTAAVLRRRLASEVKAPTTTTTAATSGGGSVSASVAATSTAAGGGAALSNAASTGGGASTSPSLTVSSNSSSSSPANARGVSGPPSPGQTLLLPEASLRRQPGSPSPLSPTINITTGAGAGATLSHPGTPALSAASASPGAAAVSSMSATAAESNSTSLAAVNNYTSAATSLNATVRTEGSGKEGSPDPDVTPLTSAESIKLFLYEHVLRPMTA